MEVIRIWIWEFQLIIDDSIIGSNESTESCADKEFGKLQFKVIVLICKAHTTKFYCISTHALSIGFNLSNVDSDIEISVCWNIYCANKVN